MKTWKELYQFNEEGLKLSVVKNLLSEFSLIHLFIHLFIYLLSYL